MLRAIMTDRRALPRNMCLLVFQLVALLISSDLFGVFGEESDFELTFDEDCRNDVTLLGRFNEVTNFDSSSNKR